MEITILFDNHNPNGGARSLWGFSAYVGAYNLLFDTGSNGRALLRNMEQLGIDVRQIEYRFLSHEHWDHIGGVDSILEANPNLTIFAPNSLSKNMIADLRTQSKEVIVCDAHPRPLVPGLYSTGVRGKTPEHALLIDGDTPTLVTGCGHEGIGAIADTAATLIDKPLGSVVGGFHLHGTPAAETQAIIDKLKKHGITQVLPTHCTGEKAMAMFEEAFGAGYVAGGIGARFVHDA